MDVINAIQFNSLTTGQPGTAAADKPDTSKGGFGQWLERSLGEVNQLQNVSNDAMQKLISGETKDIHGTMIAMQKSSIAMELTMEVRNKIIAAYEEVKRMQF